MTQNSLPVSFVSRIQSQLTTESGLFFESLKQESPVSIRINPEKKIDLGDEKISWCSIGFYLPKRPSFTLEPLFHAGCYYVQDASSMFLEQVFLQLGLTERKLLILDACAAPGGKSTHIASLMSEDSLLVSNEVIGSRITVLKENTIKWGNPNVLITNNDPSAFSSLENLFDVILVDAPCSGEGLFRKDHDAMEQWSESNCEISASRQQRILTALLPALKPGGILIYSTCTFNPKENEENIKWICENAAMECVELRVNDDWGIKKVKDKNCIGYAFHPHHVKGEGLFISVLKKKEAAHPALRMKTRSTQFAPIIKKFGAMERWITDTNHKYALVQRDEMIFVLQKEWLPLIEFLSGNLRIVHSGTCIAELKGDKPVPTHELAMSSLLNKVSFTQVEVSKEDALHYLRKEDFKIPSMPKGYALITFSHHPLGFINFLGNRFNNYYPANWRIRMK